MTDIEMLPLPPRMTIVGDDPDRGHWVRVGEAEDYARAVAEHNVKERDAEIEAVTAEAFEWRGLFDMAKARADKAEARAERLAEALRLALKWAEVLPTGEPLRAESVRDLDTARAALRDHDQENSRE